MFDSLAAYDLQADSLLKYTFYVLDSNIKALDTRFNDLHVI